MNLPTILFSLLGWMTILLFVGGLSFRIYRYAITPAPLKITLNGPPTLPGVAGRMAGEVLLFKQVLKTNPVLWVEAWVFHVSFLLVVFRHLRFFFYPVPGWIMFFYSFGAVPGYFMLGALLLLLARRLIRERNIYISLPVDYFLLFLLIGIAATGLWMNYADRPYIIDLKAFVLGLFSFTLDTPKMQPVLVVHLLLAFTFLSYFPFSKLLHAPGVFFSPTLFQRNDIEKRRTVNPWDYPVPSEPFYTFDTFEEHRTDKHPEVIHYPPGWKRKVEYDKYKKGE